MAARSKAWVCVRSLAGIVGSNPTGDMDVCCGCCVLSGGGLCDEPITRPKESFRLWWVVVCGLGTSGMRRPLPTGGCCSKTKYSNRYIVHVVCCPKQTGVPQNQPF